jgi:hypothetical protein
VEAVVEAAVEAVESGHGGEGCKPLHELSQYKGSATFSLHPTLGSNYVREES